MNAVAAFVGDPTLICDASINTARALVVHKVSLVPYKLKSQAKRNAPAFGDYRIVFGAVGEAMPKLYQVSLGCR